MFFCVLLASLSIFPYYFHFFSALFTYYPLDFSSLFFALKNVFSLYQFIVAEIRGAQKKGYGKSDCPLKGRR